MNHREMCSSFKILCSYPSGSSRSRSNHSLHPIEKESNLLTTEEPFLYDLKSITKNDEKKGNELYSLFLPHTHKIKKTKNNNSKTNIRMNDSAKISDCVISSYEDLFMNTNNNGCNVMKTKCTEPKDGEHMISRRRISKDVKKESDYVRMSSTEKDRNTSCEWMMDSTKKKPKECPEKQRTNLHSFYKYNSLKNKNECYINRKSSSQEKEGVEPKPEDPKLDVYRNCYFSKSGNKNAYCYISSSFSSLRKCNSESNDELEIRKGKSEEIYKNKNHTSAQESDMIQKDETHVDPVHYALLNNYNGTNELNTGSKDCITCKHCKNSKNNKIINKESENRFVMQEHCVSHVENIACGQEEANISCTKMYTPKESIKQEMNQIKEESSLSSILYDDISMQPSKSNPYLDPASPHLDMKMNIGIESNLESLEWKYHLKHCHIRRSYLSDQDILYSESAGSSSFDQDSSLNETTVTGIRLPIGMNKKVQSDSLLVSNREYMMNGLFNSPYSSNSNHSLDGSHEHITEHKKGISCEISVKSTKEEECSISLMCRECSTKSKKNKKKKRQQRNSCIQVGSSNVEEKETYDRSNVALCTHNKNVQESSVDVLLKTHDMNRSNQDIHISPLDYATNRNRLISIKEITNTKNTNEGKKVQDTYRKEMSPFDSYKNHESLRDSFKKDLSQACSYIQIEKSTSFFKDSNSCYGLNGIKGSVEETEEQSELMNTINKYTYRDKRSKELIKECRKTLSKKLIPKICQKNKKAFILEDGDSLHTRKQSSLHKQRNHSFLYSQMRPTRSTEEYKSTDCLLENSHSASCSKILIPKRMIRKGKKEMLTLLNTAKVKNKNIKNKESCASINSNTWVIDSKERMKEETKMNPFYSNSNSNHRSSEDFMDTPRKALLQKEQPMLSHVLVQRKDSSISDGILYNYSNDSTKNRLYEITYLFHPEDMQTRRNGHSDFYREKQASAQKESGAESMMEAKEQPNKKKIIERKTILQHEYRNDLIVENQLKPIENKKQKETNSSATLLTNTKFQNILLDDETSKKNVYCIVGLIDYGMKSQVYKCVNVKDQKVYALKVVSKESSALNENDFIEKYNFLKKNPHKNIINIYDVYEDEENNFIIMELCKGPTLLDYFMTLVPGTLQIYEIKQIMWNIFLALDFLHSRNIIHRDVKFENVMFKKEISSNDYELYESSDPFSYLEESSLLVKKECSSTTCRRNANTMSRSSRANLRTGASFKNHPIMNRLNNEKKLVQSIDVIQYSALSSGSIFSNHTGSNESVSSSFYGQQEMMNSSMGVQSNAAPSFFSSSNCSSDHYEEINRVESLRSSCSVQSLIYFNEYECNIRSSTNSELLHGSNTRIILRNQNPLYEDRRAPKIQSEVVTFPNKHTSGICNKRKCNIKNPNERKNKRENIFNNLSLIDMDLMELVESDKLFLKTKTDMICGTAPYMSPESLDGIIFTGNDTWACGVILYALMDGHFPFEINNSMPTYVKQHILTKTKPKFDPSVWEEHPELFDLCRRLLDPNPLTRIQNAREALIHYSFNEILYGKHV